MALMAPVMVAVEDFADRVSPNLVKSFLKPMLFCLICTPIVVCVLGPLGGVIGTALASVFAMMYGAVPWLTVAILSALMPFIVMTGMHYALLPLFMSNIANLGYDVVILVTMFCSNIAQGGACFGVAAKTKDIETKSEGLACGISAAVAGITEPGMYGINLRFMKPMYAAVAAAGLSGLWCGLTGVKGYTMGIRWAAPRPSCPSSHSSAATLLRASALCTVLSSAQSAVLCLSLSLLSLHIFFTMTRMQVWALLRLSR